MVKGYEESKEVKIDESELSEFEESRRQFNPADVDWTKPLSERLKPDSPMHTHLVSKLQEMIRDSEEHIEQRYEDWDRVDEAMRLYLDLTRPQKLGDGSDDSTGKKNMPYKDSISMPLIYSTIMTRVAVLYSQLTMRTPAIHLEGRGSEDLIGARVIEALAQYDMEQSEFELQVWQAIMDTERYGLAIWYDTWEEKWGYQARTGMSPIERMLAEQRGDDTREFVRIKEWNNVRTIDPREFRPDPNCPISKPQEMNYIGHKDYANYLWYAERQLKDGNGAFFNLEDAREQIKGGKNDRNSDGRSDTGDYNSVNDTEYPNLPVVHLQWKIIPSDWGLAKRDTPEIWWFSVVEDGTAKTIIRCHRSVYDHNEFTYGISVPDYDGHAPFVPGIAQQLLGIQDTGNWLINSHIVNARKVINDMVIYNDDLLDPVDMASPGPAKHIRLTRRGKKLHEMGQIRIQDMYGQFAVADITKGHLETVQFLYPQAQRMASTPDTLQGMPLPSKRTLGEVEQVNQSATLRLGQAAVLIDRQLIMPMAKRLVMNRQQFMTKKLTVRLVGRLFEQLAERSGNAANLEIAPEDFPGQFDYVPHTPTMAPDPSRMTQVWGQLLTLIGQAPQLLNPDPTTGKAIDPFAIFDEFVRSAGIEYLDQFKKTMQPMPGQAGPGQMPPDQPSVSGMAGAPTPAQTEKSVQSGNIM